jgi:multidrug efflux system membrane fusion protein
MAETIPAAGKPASTAPPVRKDEPKAQEKKRHGWIWVVVALALVAIALLVVLRRHKPPPPPPRPTVISTTNAQSGDIDVTVMALGLVTPVYTVGISPRVDGQLMSINYVEGQMVNTNDLLLEIDPNPYMALLLEAQGQLVRDNAQLEAAKIDLQRYQAAYDKKAIPQQQVADQAALVHQNEGTVQLDEGQVTNAQVQLNYCYIRAPINGRVGLRLVDPGNVVHAANTNAMVVITQLQPITVVFSVAEDYLPQIMRQLATHKPMRVEAYDRTQEKMIATGTLLTLDNMIDTSTGTIRIKAVFPNDDFSLFPNQFVNAKLIIDTLRDVTLIPTAAIQRNPQGAFVYVVTNNPGTNRATNEAAQSAPNEASSTNKFVAMRNITPGVTDTNSTSVEGLDPGEIIATDNFNKLEDGMKVTLRQPAGGGPRGGAPGAKKHRKKEKAQEDPS